MGPNGTKRLELFSDPDHSYISHFLLQTALRLAVAEGRQQVLKSPDEGGVMPIVNVDSKLVKEGKIDSITKTIGNGN